MSPISKPQRVFSLQGHPSFSMSTGWSNREVRWHGSLLKVVEFTGMVSWVNCVLKKVPAWFSPKTTCLSLKRLASRTRFFVSFFCAKKPRCRKWKWTTLNCPLARRMMTTSMVNGSWGEIPMVPTRMTTGFFHTNNGVQERSGSGLPNQTMELGSCCYKSRLKFRKTRGVVDSLHLLDMFEQYPQLLWGDHFICMQECKTLIMRLRFWKVGWSPRKDVCGSWDYPLAQSPQSSLGE